MVSDLEIVVSWLDGCNQIFNSLQSANQHCDLNFRGINYSADVFVNGHHMVLPKGMFRRHCLDVTDILHPDGTNLLAVLVHPPDHPGKIPSEGGQGGDHEVMTKYYLLISSLGC